MELDKQALDNWITNIPEPEEEFNNDPDKLYCDYCEYEDKLDEFIWENDCRAYCPKCNKLIWED